LGTFGKITLDKKISSYCPFKEKIAQNTEKGFYQSDLRIVLPIQE
jgi:hypothetical protein